MLHFDAFGGRPRFGGGGVGVAAGASSCHRAFSSRLAAFHIAPNALARAAGSRVRIAGSSRWLAQNVTYPRVGPWDGEPDIVGIAAGAVAGVRTGS